MRSKRISILFGMFLILFVFVFLKSAVFSLKTINLTMLDSSTNFAESEVIASCGVLEGESIFSVDKTQMKENVQSSFPFLKVVEIESVFPNEIIIFGVERTSLFVFNTQAGSVYCDDEGVVLKKSTTTFSNNATNEILVQVETSLSFSESTPSQKVLLTESEENIFKNFAYAVFEWENNLETIFALIESVSVGDELCVNMRTGVSFCIQDASELLSDKFCLAMSIYNSDAKYQNTGEIEVRKNSENEIYAIYNGN